MTCTAAASSSGINDAYAVVYIKYRHVILRQPTEALCWFSWLRHIIHSMQGIWMWTVRLSKAIHNLSISFFNEKRIARVGCKSTLYCFRGRCSTN